MDKIDFFAHLLLVASDDGAVVDSEKSRLREVAKRLGLSRNDIDDAVRRLADRQRPLPSPATQTEAKAIIAEMVQLMFADGEPAELEFILLLSVKWGGDPMPVSDLWRRCMTDSADKNPQTSRTSRTPSE